MSQRIGFLFLGPVTHIHHGASIAFELATLPGHEVTIFVSSALNADTVNALAQRYGSACRAELLHPGRLQRLLRSFKKRLHPRVNHVLANNARRLLAFDALVVPDGHAPKGRGRRPALIHTGHGAGDRARSFFGEMARYDFLLVPGREKWQRLEALGYVSDTKGAIIGYPKFDLAQRGSDVAKTWFGNGNPVVLYNPHFNEDESSWPVWGERVLDYFLAHPQFNLVFAPHMLLFSKQRNPIARKYLEAPNIRVDLDSPALFDMSYTARADLYLGDVSSQVYEYVAYRQRPCLFLNAQGAAWRDNDNFRMWRMGAVVEEIGQLDAELAAAESKFASYLPAQQALVRDTFSVEELPAGRRGAQAIAAFLARRKADAQ